MDIFVDTVSSFLEETRVKVVDLTFVCECSQNEGCKRIGNKDINDLVELSSVPVTLKIGDSIIVIENKRRCFVKQSKTRTYIVVETLEQIEELLIKTKLSLRAINKEICLVDIDNGIW